MEDDLLITIKELKTKNRMNELKIEAMLKILLNEGAISRKDFENELEELCDKEKKKK